MIILVAQIQGLEKNRNGAGCLKANNADNKYVQGLDGGAKMVCVVFGKL